MSGRCAIRRLPICGVWVKETGGLGLSVLLALACNGRLAVLDPPLTDGVGGSGGSGASQPELDAGVPDAPVVTTDAHAPPEPSPCTCGSSEALRALGCGDHIAGAPVVSDDGRTVAFDMCDALGFCEPYVWTQAGGVRVLPRRWNFTLVDLSRDGKLMLVTPRDTIGAEATVYHVDDGLIDSTGWRPVWTELLLKADGTVFGLYADPDNVQLARTGGGAPPEFLGILPFARENLELLGARDAAVVVGAHRNGGQLFRWTAAEGLVIEPEGWPRITDNSTLALSRDGSSLGAYVSGPDSSLRIVRVRGSTVTDISTSAPSSVSPLSVSALGISADGSVLAGSTLPSSAASCEQNPLTCQQRFSAFRWTEAGGMVELTPGSPSRTALLSSDGSLIVGWSLAAAPELFTWTAERGARSVSGQLQAAGVDLSGWLLDEPAAASPDGHVVVGQARCGTGTTIYRLALPD